MVEEGVTWQKFVYDWIIRHCSEKGLSTFSLAEIYEDGEITFQAFKPKNKHVKDKIRQQLQYLRNREYIEFVDNRGSYRLRGVFSLERELKKTGTIDLKKDAPERQEYVKETKVYARERKFVRETKERLGHDCIYKKCGNSFLKPNKELYIEVHHILPLCEGGEDDPLNLSVLCAHHHRMAHFADEETRRDVKNYLLKEIKCRL